MRQVVAVETPPTMISFMVPGIPAPGGSKRAFTRRKGGEVVGVGVVDDAKHNAPWRALVTMCARDAYNCPPIEQGIPLILHCTFMVTRPKSHFGQGRNRGKLKDSAPKFPTGKPDTVKLTRAVEDALTGVIWHDDSQVVVVVAQKRYGDTPCAKITVQRRSLDT